MKKSSSFKVRRNTLQKHLRKLLIAMFALGQAAFANTALGQEPPVDIEFNADIRPILSDKCFHCHGPDAETREANLRFDTADGLRKDLGGYFAVVPGNPEDSEIYKRIIHTNPEDRMPPANTHKIVSDEEIVKIYKWIEQGAQWQGHWAFEDIKNPNTPNLSNKSDAEDWVQTPIDSFVLARMQKAKLSPSEKADKATLIRRLYLDLTGLPPTHEAVTQFVNDKSPDAYEKLVDDLLATQAFGENQAHYWLDAARYADTHGLHLDNYRSIWPYRDWVVNAFNQNMPFDQFTIEQLAGDLLPNPTQSQLVATGFSRSSPTTSEGGAIDKEYLAIYAKDRTDTMATVWMGLTVGCAGCHDHKFDPVSQKEFYQLTAFFRNTTEKAMDGNVFDSPPSIDVFNGQQLALKQAFDTKAQDIDKSIKEKTKQELTAMSSWLLQQKDQPQGKLDTLPVADDNLLFHLPANEGKGNTLNYYANGKAAKANIKGNHEWTSGELDNALALNKSSLIEFSSIDSFDYKDPFTLSFWVRPPSEKIKSQALAGHIDVDNSTGWWDWDSKTAGWFVELENNKSVKLTLNYPDSDMAFGVAYNILEVDKWQHVVVQYNGIGRQNSFTFYVDGKLKPTNNTKSLRTNDIFAKPYNKGVESPITIGFAQNPYAHKEDRNDPKIIERDAKTPFVGLQDLRVFKGLIDGIDLAMLTNMPQIKDAMSKSEKTEQEKALLAKYYTTQIDNRGQALLREKRKQIAQMIELRREAPTTLVMHEKENPQPFAHVLIRGAYDNEGEKVLSGTPSMLPPINKTEQLNRLDLAKWLVSDEHPLTARVTINRFWQNLFGKGLVETAGDFGSQGTSPSHPELLDWLAHDFRSNGWDVKRAIKQMVMSAVYQQSSVIDPSAFEIDPENILLARAHRNRLKAESIRDQALHVSGLLVDKVGGPPVKPYQPDGLWKVVAYVDSNTAKFQQDSGDSLYRKSLYTFRKRTASPPGMALFDSPSRESCSVTREQTNTPLQALLLMNDPQFIEAARHVAQRLMQTSTNDKFTYLIQHTLGREPDEATLAILQSSFNEIRNLYEANTSLAADLLTVGESPVDESLDKTELATWTMLASQIFNLDEFITRN